MSIKTAQDAILDTFQRNPLCDAEFANPLTGTATSNGTAVTGVGTLFSTELKVGDYIGDITSGYRRVTSITDDLHCTVKSAFLVNLSHSAIKKTEVRRGFPKNADITATGRQLRVAFFTSAETDVNCPNTKVRCIYGFLIIVGFLETDEEEVEERKSMYDAMVKNIIDMNPDFGGAVVGNTDAGKMTFAEHPQIDGVFFGSCPLVVERREIRGQR